MKKVICFLMAILMAISVLCLPVLANEEVSVALNGEVLEFDVQPQIINGRTMVPMRKIFESLGATVEWDGNTKKITARRQDKTVIMHIDSSVLSVNGNPITLDVPPQLVDGRTLVPVRAVAESFDIHVIWDEVYNTVVLSTYIPFDTPRQTFDYLCDWLIENGKAFAEYVYVGWEVADGVEVEVRCYPDAVDGRSCITFSLNTIKIDDGLTHVTLWPTYDGTDVYASYINSTETSRIDGEINMTMHTDNYPLKYIECKVGEDDTILGVVEDTRKRINYLLDEIDILLSAKNTGVTLNTLGFKKH